MKKEENNLFVNVVKSAHLVSFRDNFLESKRKRHQCSDKGEKSLLLRNGKILLPAPGFYLEGHDILVNAGFILAMGPSGSLQYEPAQTVQIDLHCKVVMPGLCDAHVHCTALSANLSSMLSLPESYVAVRAAETLEGMLKRGFTTVRDAGGADFGLAQAVEDGFIAGPRVLFTGHALSQTGGHGDFRGRGEECCACGVAMRGIGRVVDGDAEVRRAARDELRKGAHAIKVMASGGVASPTDKLTSTQFSMAELRAIVEEAEAAGSYVCAHAYMPDAILRAVAAGVRSIEHGNFLDEASAKAMKEAGTFLVPTLITYKALQESGEAAGMSPVLVAKVGDCVSRGLESLSLAAHHGIPMVFGSDLLGDLHTYQSREFELRSSVLPSVDVLRSATINAASLFMRKGLIGDIVPGALADLIIIEGDPLADVSVLAKPESSIVAVMKDGLFAWACFPEWGEANRAILNE